MSAPLVKPVLPPYAIAPRPGSTSWWTGDHTQLAYHHPGDPLPHFVSRRAVLSAEQCRLLIDCFERCRESCSARDTDEYWAGRFIWQNFLPDSETAALRLMQQLRSLSLILLYQAFRPERPVYSDTAQLVRWHEGLELTPHVDNMEPDGRPNNTCHRSFASICYLNDDYEGGETYFPGHWRAHQADAGRADRVRRRPRIRARRVAHHERHALHLCRLVHPRIRA